KKFGAGIVKTLFNQHVINIHQNDFENEHVFAVLKVFPDDQYTWHTHTHTHPHTHRQKPFVHRHWGSAHPETMGQISMHQPWSARRLHVDECPGPPEGHDRGAPSDAGSMLSP